MALPAGAIRSIAPDPIFGISEAFAADPRPEKVNLTVGIYVDEHGQTPVLESVREAERRILAAGASKTYRSIEGDPVFRAAVAELVFGAVNRRLRDGSVRAFQALGGTGALRVAADFAMQTGSRRTAWVPDPTWPNHAAIFKAAGFAIERYPYVLPGGSGLAASEMLARLDGAAVGDVVVLQAACHNPTGLDPSLDLWRELAAVAVRRDLLPVIDFAYQGFGDGLREDAAWLAAFDRPDIEFLVATSYSKNFSLYNERVGALILVATSAERATAASSHIKVAIRSNYSNPPAHGSDIVAMILTDPGLRGTWEAELARMRSRVHDNRSLLVDHLHREGDSERSTHLAQQRGMFAYPALSDAAVARLRDEWGIYVTAGGRINLAGLASDSVGRVAAAVRRSGTGGTFAGPAGVVVPWPARDPEKRRMTHGR